MGFTRLSSSGVAAVKGHWATMMHGAMQAAISAKMGQVAASAAPRAAGSGNGKATSAKNRDVRQSLGEHPCEQGFIRIGHQLRSRKFHRK